MCANNIKALRVASKKTQTQVAKDLGVKLDRCRRQLTPITIARLPANVFDTRDTYYTF